MNRYLVGGAVRDQLLGVPVRERDWLVTGSSAAELIALGYRPVGREFTVFLHPDSGEEHALPRGTPGDATDERALVEADLRRRDLTINAIARDGNGSLIDPLDGVSDLQAGRLRHTPAFTEDPIRVLRLARLAARYRRLGFQVAPETCTLVRQMVEQGRLQTLTPERVWQEMEKALAGASPRTFFETLRQCAALAPLLPELDRLFGIPQPARWHPEIDCGEHSLLTLERAAELSPLPEVRFAALLHDIGKGTTPAQQWPRHIGHETRGARLMQGLCQRLKTPNRYRDLGLKAARYHTDCHRTRQLRPRTLLRLLQALDALRRPPKLQSFLLVCEADYRGRTGWEQRSYPQAAWLQQARQAALSVDVAAIAVRASTPQQIARHIQLARERAILAVKSTWPDEPVLNNLPWKSPQ